MTVAHIKHDQYKITGLKQNIVAGVDLLGGFDKLLAGKKTILLKPNLVSSGPTSQHHTTHPNFMLAVAELLLDHNFKVGLADSPGTGSSEAQLKQRGVLEPLQQLGVKCFSFTSGELVQADQRYKGLNKAKELEEWDGLVNLPKIKSHQQSLFTGATKNLFGCLSGKQKAWAHFQSKDDLPNFMGMIATFAGSIQPDLNIADGITALHRGGPIHGEAFPLGSILVSDQHLELDWAICQLIGLTPEDTPLFKVAEIPNPEVLGQALEPAQGFVFPYLMPITFNPLKLMVSFLKGLMAKYSKA